MGHVLLLLDKNVGLYWFQKTIFLISIGYFPSVWSSRMNLMKVCWSVAPQSRRSDVPCNYPQFSLPTPFCLTSFSTVFVLLSLLFFFCNIFPIGFPFPRHLHLFCFFLFPAFWLHTFFLGFAHGHDQSPMGIRASNKRTKEMLAYLRVTSSGYKC